MAPPAPGRRRALSEDHGRPAAGLRRRGSPFLIPL
ncbi:hypothetical protein CN070_09025 [Sinorhizobium meliloti]|nr:hypothetical protein CN070_09025 [Sinorhizobium meliloti]